MRNTEIASQIGVRSQPLHLVPHQGRLQNVLGQLFQDQRACDPADDYLLEHGSRVHLDNHTRTFLWYRQYLPDAGKILDWGCNHAPDSCLLRACFGDRFRLHACDFAEEGGYRAFHDFANVSYTQLQDRILLPYPDDDFDVVIASGVLEHVSTDYESLKEVRRVLKPEGLLIISYLPNWLSVQEWIRRVIRKTDYHRRLYGKMEINQLLKRAGFYPLQTRYHTFLWERALTAFGAGRWERPLSHLVRCLLPVHVLSSTLCVAARKVVIM